MKITAENNGHTYDLSEDAIIGLIEAINANQADAVFEGFASHVPAKDRCGVWMAIDDQI